jgi:muramoyltetrapeptide carboxypeptidase
MRIAVVAASSVVPRVELDEGVERLRVEGLEVRVWPQVYQRHFTYAGDDVSRARAFYDAACDPDIEVVWMARGGYGAARVTRLVEEWGQREGLPSAGKLLAGYSDVTVLHEYARRRWGWATLHAPMPAEADFGRFDARHWRALIDLVRRRHPGSVWGTVRWVVPPTQDVEGMLVGGNLSLWASMVGTGTEFEPSRAAGGILFLEDIGERYYRIDRMLQQVVRAGLLEGCRAIVLGDFADCDDDPVKMVRGQRPGERVPLRPRIGWEEAVAEIFGKLGVPVAVGLPVGHGPNFAPLPLGARYRVGADGAVELVGWEWLNFPRFLGSPALPSE